MQRNAESGIERKENKMKLVNIGFGNMVSAEKLVAIVGHQSAPATRDISLMGHTAGRPGR